MDMDGFRQITAGSSQILTDCEWFQLAVDDSGQLQIVLGGSLWVVADDFGQLLMISGGFRWF